MSKRGSHQLLSSPLAGATVGFDFGLNFFILVRARHDRGECVVLGSGADKARPANINLLDRLRFLNARFRNRFCEWVQVNNDQLKRLDVVVSQRLEVRIQIVAAKDAGKNFRMERFDSAIHHFRKPRIGGDINDRHAGFFKVTASPSGAVNFDAFCGQGFREVGDSRFIADANQGAFNLR